MSPNGADRWRFGPYEVDLRTKELWKHGTRLKLGGQPFEILSILISQPGELISRDELQQKIWPADTYVDFNHGLNAAVNKLREVLSDSAESPKYIETLPRRGYRFIATVEKSQPAAAPRPEPAAVTPAPQPSEPSLATATQVPISGSASTPAEPSLKGADASFRIRWGRVLIYALPALSVVLVVFVLVGWLHRQIGNRITEVQYSRVVPLTTFAEPAVEPAFSPDGNQVAFKRDSIRDGASGIYVKLIGSEHVLQLTHNKTDCCPVWSPDGRAVAFSRYEKDRAIYTVPALGGPERKLYAGSASQHGEIDWAPDGKHIAFAEGQSHGTTSIALLSLDDLRVSKLTDPPSQDEDWGPAFSPDGRQLAFVRSGSTGFPKNLMMTPSDGSGEVRRVTNSSAELGPPAWTPDGRSLVFSSHLNGQPTLFRIPASGGEPTQVPEVGALTWHPAISRNGSRLAFQQILTASSIWQLELKRPDHRVPVTSTKGRNDGPQFSPDGKRVAFMSDRSGSMEVWASDRDGANPVQYSSLNTGCGTPRWSPDSKTLVFDCQNGGDHTGIYLANTEGGVQRPLVVDSHENAVPSWSRDGRFVYFASDRTGEFQVWKIALEGGPPIQITTQGGFAAVESPDGQSLYYAKHRFPDPPIWRANPQGGGETPVSPLLKPKTWANWVLVGSGIYYVTNEPDRGPAIRHFALKSMQDEHVAALDHAPFWLTISPDGIWASYEQTDLAESNIMLLQNFR